MAKSKDSNEQDIDLFRKEMVNVTRLDYELKIPISSSVSQNSTTNFSKKESTKVADTISDILESESVEVGDELFFFRPGVQHGLMKKLKRGQLGVGAELDLHGMTAKEARQSILTLLHECLEQKVRCVRIVHGKGKSSRNRLPILKNKINHWLPQLDDVLAFCSARPEDGGVGAVYVLLRRS